MQETASLSRGNVSPPWACGTHLGINQEDNKQEAFLHVGVTVVGLNWITVTVKVVDVRQMICGGLANLDLVLDWEDTPPLRHFNHPHPCT